MLLSIIMLLGIIAFALPAQSSTVTFNYNKVLSGWIRPATSPWLTATFEDFPDNRVKLTLSASGLSGTEQVESWYFNLNPAKEILTIGNIIWDGGLSSGPSGQIEYRDPGPGYEIQFTYLDDSNLFLDGKVNVYWITSSQQIRASDFNYRTDSGICSDCDYLSAAHIKGTADTAPGTKVKVTDAWVHPTKRMALYQMEIAQLHSIDLNLAAINKRLGQLNEFETLPKGATNSLEVMADQLLGLKAKLEEVLDVLPTPGLSFIGQDEATFALDCIRIQSNQVYENVDNIVSRMDLEPSPFLPLFNDSRSIIFRINDLFEPVKLNFPDFHIITPRPPLTPGLPEIGL